MSDANDPPDADAVRSGRRRFLKRAGALAAAAPLAAALQAVADPGAAEAAGAKAKPAAKPAADPFASARPDTTLCRTPAERATLEQQWKGMVDLVKVVHDAPLDPAVEPATTFAALPRIGPARARRTPGRG